MKKTNSETMKQEGRKMYSEQKAKLESRAYTEYEMPFGKLHKVFTLALSAIIAIAFYYSKIDICDRIAQTDALQLTGWFIILCMMVAGIFAIHEKIHAIAFSILGGDPEQVLYCEESNKNLLKWKFSTVCTVPMSRIKYIICCAAPGVLTSAVLAIPAFFMLDKYAYAGRFFLQLVFIANLAGCSSDIVDVLIAAFAYRKKDVMLLGYPDRTGFAFFVGPEIVDEEQYNEEEEASFEEFSDVVVLAEELEK